MTSCGLIVAIASKTPANTSRRCATALMAAAIMAATKTVNCCSFKPCTAGKQLNVSTVQAILPLTETRHPRVCNHKGTEIAVISMKSQNTQLCTVANGNLTVGASINTTYTGYANAC